MTAHILPVGTRDFNGLYTFVRAFNRFGTATREAELDGSGIPVVTNEFWTARQRAAHSLHEVSYRACFKPQLPRFFITQLTRPGDRVYDPFMGRGTTVLEAALLGRVALGCDVNPLSAALVRPRLHPPTLAQIEDRLSALDLTDVGALPEDLLVFFHPDTLRDICALRGYLLRRERDGLLDEADAWIRMVAINRLTGHSPGFFSVYTLPPNQAVTVEAQRKINVKRGQQPPYRDVRELILRKSASLLKDCDGATREALRAAADDCMLRMLRMLINRDAAHTPEIATASVDLVVTSPPFLDVVDYATDNWLRCWFIGADAWVVPISALKRLEEWQAKMLAVFGELRRVVRPGGFIAFEVGEVRNGRLKLEEAVIPVALQAGLQPRLVLINDQKFTKTANAWGVDNNSKGTNSNRIVVIQRD